MTRVDSVRTEVTLQSSRVWLSNVTHELGGTGHSNHVVEHPAAPTPLLKPAEPFTVQWIWVPAVRDAGLQWFVVFFGVIFGQKMI